MRICSLAKVSQLASRVIVRSILKMTLQAKYWLQQMKIKKIFLTISQLSSLMKVMKKLKKKPNMEKLVLEEDLIFKKLLNINVNKSAGPDQIHSRVLYELRNEIVFPLKFILE